MSVTPLRVRKLQKVRTPKRHLTLNPSQCPSECPKLWIKNMRTLFNQMGGVICWRPVNSDSLNCFQSFRALSHWLNVTCLMSVTCLLSKKNLVGGGKVLRQATLVSTEWPRKVGSAASFAHARPGRESGLCPTPQTRTPCVSCGRTGPPSSGGDCGIPSDL